MKNLIKMSIVALTVSIFAAGCSGCGDRTKPEETGKVINDSPKKAIDTTKAKIDTAKKDTSKK